MSLATNAVRGRVPEEDRLVGVAIRHMVEGDLDGVLAIAGELREAPHWTRDAYLAAIQRSGTLRGVGLVAHFEDGTEIAGFLVGSVLTVDAELESIAVAPEAQGKGMGRALLVAFEGEVGRVGAEQILLEVRASNERAIKFYFRHGFQETGRRPRYYTDPSEDSILMSKRLSLL